MSCSMPRVVSAPVVSGQAPHPQQRCGCCAGPAVPCTAVAAPPRRQCCHPPPLTCTSCSAKGHPRMADAYGAHR